MSALQTITPAIRRNLLEPVWTRLSGAIVAEETRKLERSQFLSFAEHRDRQWSAFKALFETLHSSNAFYARRFVDAGLAPGSMKSWADFARIPILSKHDVRPAGRTMLSNGFDVAQLKSAKTGGSTGKPVELFFTEELSQRRNASGRRNKAWAGWQVGEPVGAVWGNPVHPSTLKEHLREWALSPTIYLDTMNFTAGAVEQFDREWARVQPTMLFGHAHSLFLLASMARDLGLSRIRPRAIIPTSMMLPAHERAVIEEVFCAKATDIYGCEEVGLIAGECEYHDGLHLNMEQVLVEVLRDDGSAVAPGETGDVIVTDLLNYAMPFIRYRMEDMAEVASHPCGCGREMPTLRRIVGRSADFLRRRDGSQVAGISLIENTLTRFEGVDQMQIEQQSLLRIVLRLVPAADFSNATADQFIGYFRDEFPGAEIVLEKVSAIAPEPNGKYRFSICRIAN